MIIISLFISRCLCRFERHERRLSDKSERFCAFSLSAEDWSVWERFPMEIVSEWVPTTHHPQSIIFPPTHPTLDIVNQRCHKNQNYHYHNLYHQYDHPSANPSNTRRCLCLQDYLLAPKVLLDYLRPMITIRPSHPIPSTYSIEDNFS